MSKLDAKIILKKKQNSINGFNNNYAFFTIKGKDINYITINTLRRVILTLVPTFAFDPENIIIEKNTSVYNNDYMRLRLSSIPLINSSYESNKMIIKNDSSVLNKVLELEEEANIANYENKNTLTKEEENQKKENLKKLLDNLQIIIEAKNDTSDIISITTETSVKFIINNKQIKTIYPNPILILKLKPEQSRLHIKGEEFKATCISSLNIPLKNASYLSCFCSYEEIDSNNFEFKICSFRQISEETIINHACQIIILKLEKIKDKIINAIKQHNSEQALIEAQLIIVNENHTLGNLITRVIQDHPDIEFCGYNVDHLYVNELTLRYKTNGKSIIDIVDTSINYLINLYKHLILQIEKIS